MKKITSDLFPSASRKELKKRREDDKPHRIQMKKLLNMQVLDEKKELKPKEYLQQNVISLEYILRQPSLYYPGAGSDFGPFKLFSENSAISTVIYCDYKFECATQAIRMDLDVALKDEYEILNEKDIAPNIFGFSSWDAFLSPDPKVRSCSCKPLEAFGVFREMRLRSNKKVVNFIYLCTEAVQTYEVLFSDREIRPTVVLIENYMEPVQFCGKDSELYKTAKPILPMYLYTSGTAWPGYKRVSDFGEAEGGNNCSRALYIHKP